LSNKFGGSIINILSSRDAVVIIPKDPLTAGTYLHLAVRIIPIQCCLMRSSLTCDRSSKLTLAPKRSRFLKPC